jgi:signal transduction histidine kinase/HPt (histidine-containing phosphotransfer) domain-containing protein
LSGSLTIPSRQALRPASGPVAVPWEPDAAEPEATIGRCVLAGAIGLSIASVAVPIVLATSPGMRGLLGRPPVDNILLVLLLLAPAAVGLATGLSGLARVARSVAKAEYEAEHAVLRILVAALLFGAVAASVGLLGIMDRASLSLPIAASGLIAAWLLLLHIMLWPTRSITRRCCASLMDAALISAFLYAGGENAAGWYPLYLLATCYAGFRFGVAALSWSAALSLLGFAGVVATTGFWREQPALTAGLILALALVPALLAVALRQLAEQGAAAGAADVARARFISAVTEGLRTPLEALLDGGSPSDDARPEHSAALSSIRDLLAVAAIEAGTFAPRIEAFDLHALLNDTLASRRHVAATKGIALRWRIDPYLSSRVCGWREPIERVLGNLIDYAIGATEAGAVRVAVAASADQGTRVPLILTIDCGADPIAAETAAIIDPFAASGHDALGLAFVRRVLGLMGGCIGIDAVAAGQTRFTMELVLAKDMTTTEISPGSASCPVLIVTADSLFAGEVCEYLEGWDAAVLWIGEAEAALEYIAWLDPAVRAVLLVDGRTKPLAAMGLVDRALGMNGAAPFVLFVAAQGQLARLAELDDSEVDAFLPAPLQPQLLVNALHTLPLRSDPGGWQKPAAALTDNSMTSAGAEQQAAAPAADRVTPIAAHPRFAADPTPTIDAQVIEKLQELGGEDDFLHDVIETFRSDAAQIMRRIDRAAAVADPVAFAQGLRALRQAAGHVGGTRLCQLAVSLRGLTGNDLRDHGSAHLHRLNAQIDRLTAGLRQYFGEVEARGP